MFCHQRHAHTPYCILPTYCHGQGPLADRPPHPPDAPFPSPFPPPPPPGPPPPPPAPVSGGPPITSPLASTGAATKAPPPPPGPPPPPPVRITPFKPVGGGSPAIGSKAPPPPPGPPPPPPTPFTSTSLTPSCTSPPAAKANVTSPANGGRVPPPPPGPPPPPPTRFTSVTPKPPPPPPATAKPSGKMSDQIICEAPIPTPVTSDTCKPSSPHAPPPPASSGSSAPSHQNKSSPAPSAAADSGAEQPATDATSSSTQPASTRWVSNGGNGQQVVPQQDAGSSLGGSLEEGDDEEEEEDGEGLEGLEGAYGVQALLSLLDKSKVGMYEPDVARDVLTLVEGATVVGDLPNKHPDLASEFCHALTDDHTYYSNLLASLCDGEDETNDEDLIHVAKSVKGAVYSITNPPEPPPSPTPSPTSCSSPPAPATSASLSEADDSQGASAGVTGTTENKAGDVENEAPKPRPAAPPPPPPPPPPTRAPPPPPPVGASPAAKSFTPMVPALKPKPVPAPTKKLKPIFWDAIPLPKLKGTFWVAENGDCEDVPPLDFASLEQLFAQAAPKTAAAAKASASAGAPAAAAKPKQVSLIDGKRGHNVSILMGGKIKIPPAELRAAVLKLDPRAVGNEESVAALMQCIPSADEAAALEAYTRSGKPASDLADPDRVLLEMHSIPYVEARLRCYAHKFAAPHKLHSASQVFEAICKATESIRKSRVFKTVLRTVLAAGNYLNHGTRNGNAIGFRLRNLPKLADTRSTTSNISLLQVLAVEVTRMLQPEDMNEEEEQKDGNDGSPGAGSVVLADELAAVLDPMLKLSAEEASKMLASAQAALVEMQEALATQLPQTPTKDSFSSCKPQHTPTLATSPTKATPNRDMSGESLPSTPAQQQQLQQNGDRGSSEGQWGLILGEEEEDRFQATMRRDLAELEDMCTEVKALQAAAKAAYEEVLAYFGETTNSTPSDIEFWSILSSFVERFSAAQRALLEERKLKNEREARRKQREHAGMVAMQAQASRKAQAEVGRQEAVDRLLDGASPSTLHTAAAAGLSVSHKNVHGKNEQQRQQQHLQGPNPGQQSPPIPSGLDSAKLQHAQHPQHQQLPLTARELRELEAKKRQDAIARLLATAPMAHSHAQHHHPTQASPRPSAANSHSLEMAPAEALSPSTPTLTPLHLQHKAALPFSSLSFTAPQGLRPGSPTHPSPPFSHSNGDNHTALPPQLSAHASLRMAQLRGKSPSDPTEASVVSSQDGDLHANSLLPHFPWHMAQQGTGAAAADRVHVGHIGAQQGVPAGADTAAPPVYALHSNAAEPLGGFAHDPQYAGQENGAEISLDQEDLQKLASNGGSIGSGAGDGSLLHAEELLGAIRQRQQQQWAKQQAAACKQDGLEDEA